MTTEEVEKNNAEAAAELARKHVPAVREMMDKKILDDFGKNQRDSDRERQKPMNREQRRRIDAINQEAQATFKQITEKFLQFFTTCDYPESSEVQVEIAQRDAQWRTYCRRKSLKQDGFDLVKKYCDNLVDEYKQTLKGDADYHIV